tara:strand:- start:115 stop:390 length:276 start_codon:yes stop_codon:yes gene_type:complete
MNKKQERVSYTREHIKFILENYRNKPKLCVEKTGHSDSSIRMMLGNAVCRLSGESSFRGSELYAEVVKEYLEANPSYDRPMSIEKFKSLFL